MISVSDLAPIIFGPNEKGFYAVFALYCDESADAKQERWLAVGSFFGKVEDFPKVETEWRERLAQDQVDYFHATECERLVGEFDFVAKGLDKDQKSARKRADSLRNDLATILGQSTIGGISVGLNLHDFREIAEAFAEEFRTDKVTFAYKVLIRDCITQIDKDWPESANLTIAFTFDDRADWKQAEDAYEQLKSIPAIDKRMGVVIHADDKKHPALQMADLLAHETRYALQDGTVDLNSRPALQILKESHRLYYVSTVEAKELSVMFG
jgi:hypothetical protein